jgi:pyroglutamyl-peptidase
MHPHRPVILLTGFGPFPTVAANATSVLVPRIAEAARVVLPGIAVEHAILPTEWRSGLDAFAELVARVRPYLALHFGVSSRATGFEIEVRGRNYCSSSADAAGRMPVSSCLSPVGPAVLASTLPVGHIVARLRQRGLPAKVSRDAGGYLCNALLYRSLEIARTLDATPRVGFVHLPSSLVHKSLRRPDAGCRLDWSDVVDGGVEIIAAALGRPRLPPLRRPMPGSRGSVRRFR